MNIQDGSDFPLLTTGIGYLSQLREIDSSGRQPHRYVTIAALRSSEAVARYNYIDAAVLGRSANAYLGQLSPNITKGDKVLCGFNLKDIRPGSRKEETFTSLQGELVGIVWARVNGVAVAKLEDC